MVLVPVGEHDPVDVVRALAEEGEIWQHQVDAGHLRIGEHHPAVENDKAACLLDDRAVAPDLSQPAQEGDSDRFRHSRSSPRPELGAASAPSPICPAGGPPWARASPGQAPSEGGTRLPEVPARGARPWPAAGSALRRWTGTRPRRSRPRSAPERLRRRLRSEEHTSELQSPMYL